MLSQTQRTEMTTADKALLQELEELADRAQETVRRVQKCIRTIRQPYINAYDRYPDGRL